MDKLKPRKQESPEHIYEQGRLYGILQVEMAIEKLKNAKTSQSVLGGGK